MPRGRRTVTPRNWPRWARGGLCRALNARRPCGGCPSLPENPAASAERGDEADPSRRCAVGSRAPRHSLRRRVRSPTSPRIAKGSPPARGLVRTPRLCPDLDPRGGSGRPSRSASFEPRGGVEPPSTAYKADALPLSYPGRCRGARRTAAAPEPWAQVRTASSRSPPRCLDIHPAKGRGCADMLPLAVWRPWTDPIPGLRAAPRGAVTSPSAGASS